MTGPKGGLSCGGDLQAGIIVLADEGRASGFMTEFLKQLTQVEDLCSGKSKCHVLSFCCRLSYCRLELAAVTDGAAAETESITAD